MRVVLKVGHELGDGVLHAPDPPAWQLAHALARVEERHDLALEQIVEQLGLARIAGAVGVLLAAPDGPADVGRRGRATPRRTIRRGR